ncbi:hypothetical protein Avbf_03865, partial [Armadillidium vulgare]
ANHKLLQRDRRKKTSFVLCRRTMGCTPATSFLHQGTKKLAPSAMIVWQLLILSPTNPVLIGTNITRNVNHRISTRSKEPFH